MSAIEVQHAIDLGQEALEYVAMCGGAAGPAPGQQGPLARWKARVTEATNAPSAATAARAKQKLEAFSAQMAAVATEPGLDRVLERADAGRSWGDRLWAATGRQRVSTCSEIAAEVTEAIAELHHVRLSRSRRE